MPIRRSLPGLRDGYRPPIARSRCYRKPSAFGTVDCSAALPSAGVGWRERDTHPPVPHSTAASSAATSFSSTWWCLTS